MNKGAMYLYAEEKDTEEKDAAQKGELKTFSLVRMQSAEMLDEAFDAPPLDINQHLAGSLGLFAGGDIRDVRIQFNHQVASFIRERQWHPSQNILTREDGSAEFTAQLAVSREIVQWVLGFGSAARVLGPSELIQAVALEAAEITKIYQNQQGV
jgi:proteasome accessory factor B